MGAVDTIQSRARPVRQARSKAFLEANQHSGRVRFLKRAIVLASAAAFLGLAGVTFFDPFGKLPQGVSVGQTTLDGTRITMELPKLSGFRKDGRAYEVRAASGVQDIKTPKIIELRQIEARVAIGPADSVNASAPIGVLDSGRDFLQLRSGAANHAVRIASTSGYEIVLQDADIDFHNGTVLSDQQVSVKLPNGTLSADRFSMADNGQSVSFDGHVVSEISEDRPDARGVKASANP